MKSATLRSLSTRDTNGYHQYIAEVLRSVIARSDDIAQLQSLHDSQHLHCPYVQADQLVTDIELREDWRISREDCVLLSLNAVNIDTASQRTSFEKTVKQFLNVILRFLAPPSVRDLNSSELHLTSVMSVKVCPQNTLIEIDCTGRKSISVLGTTPETKEWSKSMCKEVRIIEACLYGDSVNVGLVMSTCLRFSRKVLSQEIAAIKGFADRGEAREPQSPVLLPVRKSPSMPFLAIRQSSHRAVIKSAVVFCDWKQKMLEALMDQNKEAVRAVSGFLAQYKARQAAKAAPTEGGNVRAAKTGRAKMYEAYGAVSPYGPAPAAKDTCEVPNVPLSMLKDVRNCYFPADSTLCRRLRTVHSILVLQKAFRAYKAAKLDRNAKVIQLWYRAILVKRAKERAILHRFRYQFYSFRLRKRLKLVLTKRRERKWTGKLLSRTQYQSHIGPIVTIQRFTRGFLTRHRRFAQGKGRKVRQSQQFEVLSKVYKQAFWAQTKPLEAEILVAAAALADQLLRLKQRKRPKALKREQDLCAYIRSLEAAGLKERRQRLGSVSEVRICILK